MSGAGGQRVAVVSGAASGIGAAIARSLLDTGWSVASFDLAASPDSEVMSVEVDMASEPDVGDAVQRVRRELGSPTAAVSSAGHYEAVPFTHVTHSQLERMLRVHLGGVLHLSRAILPGMLASGDGSIVAIASELGVGGGGAGDAHYSAAKGAVLGFVRSVAVEVAPHGVRVNAVAPGPTDTPLLADDSPWRAPEYLATLPIGRLTTPQEVARCVDFLLAEGTFCVGETLNPNSGAVI